MKIRTTRDIPDEIKNIVELFYLRNEVVSKAEIERLKQEKPELSGLVDNVLQLMSGEVAESVFLFYDDLIALCAAEEEFNQNLDFSLDFMSEEATDERKSLNSLNSGGNNTAPHHSGLNNSSLNHSGLNDSSLNHSGLNNSSLNHSGLNNSSLNHSGLNDSIPHHSGASNAELNQEDIVDVSSKIAEKIDIIEEIKSEDLPIESVILPEMLEPENSEVVSKDDKSEKLERKSSFKLSPSDSGLGFDIDLDFDSHLPQRTVDQDISPKGDEQKIGLSDLLQRPAAFDDDDQVIDLARLKCSENEASSGDVEESVPKFERNVASNLSIPEADVVPEASELQKNGNAVSDEDNTDDMAFPGLQMGNLFEDRPTYDEDELSLDQNGTDDDDLIGMQHIDIGGMLDDSGVNAELESHQVSFLSEISGSRRFSSAMTSNKSGDTTSVASHQSINSVPSGVNSKEVTSHPAAEQSARLNEIYKSEPENQKAPEPKRSFVRTLDIFNPEKDEESYSDNTLDIFEDPKHVENSPRLSPFGDLASDGLQNSHRYDFRALKHEATEEQLVRPTAMNLTPVAQNPIEILPIPNAVQSSDDIHGRPTSVGMAGVPVDNTKKYHVGGSDNPLEKIKPLMRMPKLLCKMSELSTRKDINPRAGFIISMIDGYTTIADILDISAWPAEETASLLLELEGQGIVSFY